jgi:hypothetical protein
MFDTLWFHALVALIGESRIQPRLQNGARAARAMGQLAADRDRLPRNHA